MLQLIVNINYDNKTSRAFRTWKRYQGGRAEEIYLYNLDNNEEFQLTDFEGTDRMPMWMGDRIYFSSDRDGRLNLYSVDEKGENLQQLTVHEEYDVRFPSAGPENIVYEHAGNIWNYNPEKGETQKLDITIGSDAPEARRRRVKVKDHITISIRLSEILNGKWFIRM